MAKVDVSYNESFFISAFSKFDFQYVAREFGKEVVNAQPGNIPRQTERHQACLHPRSIRDQ